MSLTLNVILPWYLPNFMKNNAVKIGIMKLLNIAPVKNRLKQPVL